MKHFLRPISKMGGLKEFTINGWEERNFSKFSQANKLVVHSLNSLQDHLSIRHRSIGKSKDWELRALIISEK